MASTAPVAPREDAWYKAPKCFETAAPGTILRLRTALGDTASKFESCVSAYNILFRTTDSCYQPSWAVTTLFVPKTTNAHSLLSYQIPYNSVDINAGPSHLLHTASEDWWPMISDGIQTALNRGWYVNFPDFEGHLAAFGNGITEGHATLDSIRASLNAGFGMDKVSTRVATWGFSGGALAGAWAAELQAHYAPELNFAGAALGGLAPDLMCLVNVPGTKWAGLIPQLLLGITAEFPAAYEYLVAQLKPERKADFLAAHQYDIAQSFMTFAGQDIFEYFSNGAEIIQHPLIRNLLLQRCLGYHGIPQMPIFVYKAVADEITPIADTDALVEIWRRVGVNVLYERNTVGDHVSEAANGRQRALDFLDSIFAGPYTHQGCTVRDVRIGVP